MCSFQYKNKPPCRKRLVKRHIYLHLETFKQIIPAITLANYSKYRALAFACDSYKSRIVYWKVFRKPIDYFYSFKYFKLTKCFQFITIPAYNRPSAGHRRHLTMRVCGQYLSLEPNANWELEEQQVKLLGHHGIIVYSSGPALQLLETYIFKPLKSVTANK